MWQLTKQKSWIELQKQFSFVADMSGVEQDPIYHAEGDVAVHTEMVLEALGASLRNKMITLFVRYQAEVDLIYLEMPYEQWQQQNKQREYAVPNAVLERMLTKLEMPTPDEAHRVSYYINR